MHDPSRRAAADLRLRPRGHWDRQEELKKENGGKERQKSLKGEVPPVHFMKAYGGVEI